MTEKKWTIAQIRQFLNSGNVDGEDLAILRMDKRKGVQNLLLSYEKKKTRQRMEEKQYRELLRYEKEWKAQGFQYIAGIDEVGRGPLAGPVTAAAAILSDDAWLLGLTDSKKLSPEKREYYYERLKEETIAYQVVHISVDNIDRVNIYQASKQAMIQAVQQLSANPDALFIDALSLPLPVKQLSITQGDTKSASIAAASVLAKVERDRYMKELGVKYPEYGFEKHMGYGTKQHLEALSKYGLTPEHRRSFTPVKEFIS